MKLDEVLTSAGKYKGKKRLGRGVGSGQGKTAGRGTKGGGARAGWGQRLGKEGGQNSIYARSPKRGFNNFNFRTDYQVVNVGDLNRFDDGATIDIQALAKVGMVEHLSKPVKILGWGELTKKLTVVANKFSTSASAKIAQVGGTATQV